MDLKINFILIIIIKYDLQDLNYYLLAWVIFLPLEATKFHIIERVRSLPQSIKTPCALPPTSYRNINNIKIKKQKTNQCHKNLKA